MISKYDSTETKKGDPAFFETEQITFEKLKEDGLFEGVMESIKWVIDRKDFVFAGLKGIDFETFGRKRKFESMLENL